MGRFENAEVFRDTERMYVENMFELHERKRYGEERQ